MLEFEGEQLYDKEIMELKERLKARGILLFVIDGERNRTNVEWGSALAHDDVEKMLPILRAVHSDLADFSASLKRMKKTDC